MVLPHEPEFEQALYELTTSLSTFLKANPSYQKALEVVQIPERVIQFRVVWEDDKGQPQVNRGYRVQVVLLMKLAPDNCTHATRYIFSTTLHWVPTKAVFAFTHP